MWSRDTALLANACEAMQAARLKDCCQPVCMAPEITTGKAPTLAGWALPGGATHRVTGGADVVRAHDVGAALHAQRRRRRRRHIPVRVVLVACGTVFELQPFGRARLGASSEPVRADVQDGAATPCWAQSLYDAQEQEAALSPACSAAVWSCCAAGAAEA